MLAFLSLTLITFMEFLGGGGNNRLARRPASSIDDSELCKMAGTPSFLTPEAMFDFGTEIPTPPCSERLELRSDFSSAGASSPPITKTINVWALGVTLYCLFLAGHPLGWGGGQCGVIHRFES